MSTQVFRVFVSSTFADMRAERAALQERVFPRLRELCAARGAQFQPIDLRWGVSEAAARDQQTMHICLSEIERCAESSSAVFFLALIGDRYGWRPLPTEISATDFERIRTVVLEKGSLDLLDYWYRRDENAVPPVFVLRERSGEFIAGAKWQSIQDQLLRIFRDAVGRLRLSRSSRLRYTASATEQEIERAISITARAGRTRAPGIFAFFRRIQPFPTTSLINTFRDIDEQGRPDPAAHKQLIRFKARLRRLLSRQITEYGAKCQDGILSPDYLDGFCDLVYARLSKAIRMELSRGERLSPLEKEILAHDLFGKQRASVFVGRASLLNLIRTELQKPPRHPLILTGPAGSGKTTLLARAVQSTTRRSPKPIVRFLGATSESSDGRLLLRSLCLQIAAHRGNRRAKLPDDYNGLVQEFLRSLSRASAKKPLVLYLDALDQITDTQARLLDWLPTNLPEHVHLIASVLPGDCLDVLRQRLPATAFVKVEPMLQSEGDALLNIWLADARRSLLPAQREDLLKNFARHGLPLYLKLGFEEVRRWRSFDGLPAGADDVPGLPADVEGILKDLFWRLSLDSNHGSILVDRSLGFLAAGRNGLTESELVEALSSDAAVMKDFRERSPESPPTPDLPFVVWSRLRFDLAPYLTERSADGTSTISFYHRQLREVVGDQFLSGSARFDHHRHLSHYFGSQPLETGQGVEHIWNLRKLSELAFQQARANEWGLLRETLTALEFLNAKVSAVGPYPLIADFDLALEERTSLPAGMADEVELIKDALRLSAHILAQDPRELDSQLCARLVGMRLRLIDQLSQPGREQKSGAWLRPYSSGLTPAGSPLRQTFTGLNCSNHVVVSPDGRLAICSDDDGTFWIFDLQANTLKQTIEAPREWMTAATMHPDQPLAAFGSEKGEIWWIDPVLGKVVARRKSDESGIEGLSFMQTAEGWKLAVAHENGQLAIHALPPSNEVELFDLGEELSALAVGPAQKCYCGAAKKIIVWDAALRKQIATLADLPDNVTALAFSPDFQTLAVGYNSGAIDLWNDLGEAPIALAGHREQPTRNTVSALHFTPDGQRLVSVSWDETLRIWERTSGKEVGRFTGHSMSVYGLDLVPETELAVTVSKDGTMRVWDLTRLTKADQRARHDAAVDALAVSDDWVVSASRDRTLWLWDLKTGAPIRQWTAHEGAKPHEGWITTVALDAANGLIYSAGKDSTLRTWKLADGTALKVVKGDWQSGASLALTTDGSKMLVTDNEHTQTPLAIWRPSGTRKAGVFKPKIFGGGALAVSADGRWALVADFDETVTLADVDKLRSVWKIKVRGSKMNGVVSIAISQDATTALFGHRRGRLQSRRLKDGRLNWSFAAHSGQATAVSISPDGKLCCSAGWDRVLRVWNLRDRSPVASFSSDDFWSACQFAPDGRTIVAADERGCLHFLKLEGHDPG